METEKQERPMKMSRQAVPGPPALLPTSSPHRDDIQQPPGVGQPALIHTEEA
jgi:hypothetical protein